MAQLFLPPVYQVSDANGAPVSGAKLYFYQTGTTTPITVYQDSDKDTAHTNPVIADSKGQFPPIYVDSATYKIVLKDASDVTIQTVDPVNAGGVGGVEAGTMGLLILQDETAADVHEDLGGGTAGIEVYESETQEDARNALGIGSISREWVVLAIGDSRMSGEEPKGGGSTTLEPIPTDPDVLGRAKNWNDDNNQFEQMALNGDGTDSPVARTAWEIATRQDKAWMIDCAHSGSVTSDFLSGGTYNSEVFGATTGHPKRALTALGKTYLDAVIVSLGANENSQSFSVNDTLDDILDLMAAFRASAWFGPRTRVYWIEMIPYNDGVSGKNPALHLAAMYDQQIHVVSAFGQIPDLAEDLDAVHETSKAQVLMGQKLGRSIMGESNAPRYTAPIPITDTCRFEIGTGTKYWTRIQDFCDFAANFVISDASIVNVKIADGDYNENTIRFRHPQEDQFFFYAQDFESMTMPAEADLEETDRDTLIDDLKTLYGVTLTNYNFATEATNGPVLNGGGVWAGLLLISNTTTGTTPVVQSGLTKLHKTGGARLGLPRCTIVGGGNSTTGGIGVNVIEGSVVDLRTTIITHVYDAVRATGGSIVTGGDGSTISQIDPADGTTKTETGLVTIANAKNYYCIATRGSQVSMMSTNIINDAGEGTVWEADDLSFLAINNSDITASARTTTNRNGVIAGTS